jgi:hypothetical protein
MSIQEEFPLSIPKSWKPSTATDFPFGSEELKQPDKRPRRQLRMWQAMGIAPRTITASLRGTRASKAKRTKPNGLTNATRPRQRPQLGLSLIQQGERDLFPVTG